ncbi:MAG: AbrB/MazE/SpoVT family DNA-binding domain-containing protein [Clostridiales bacterium]|nr:AbrB/MazE/SpoVT family DNA-binding domain-containing protein [Clostridiales bacterium]
MQTTTKTVDEMGRVVLPAHMRAALDLGIGVLVQITMKEDEIIIKKQKAACTFCGREDSLTQHNGKCVCAHCRQILANQKETESCFN